MTRDSHAALASRRDVVADLDPSPSADARVLVLDVAPRSESIASLTAVEVAERLRVRRALVDVFAVRDAPLDAYLHDTPDDVLDELLSAVSRARALVLVTPIVHGALGGLAKLFLDRLPQRALREPRVVVVGVATSVVELHALDFTTAPILFALGARALTPPVTFLDRSLRRWSDGRVSFDEATTLRLELALAELVRAEPSDRRRR